MKRNECEMTFATGCNFYVFANRQLLDSLQWNGCTRKGN